MSDQYYTTRQDQIERLRHEDMMSLVSAMSDVVEQLKELANVMHRIYEHLREPDKPI